MTPQDFIQKWCLTRGELAQLVSVSVSTINQWVAKNSKQTPHAAVLKYLELIDHVWETWRSQEQSRREFPPEVADLFEVALDRRELEDRQK